MHLLLLLRWRLLLLWLLADDGFLLLLRGQRQRQRSRRRMRVSATTTDTQHTNNRTTHPRRALQAHEEQNNLK